MIKVEVRKGFSSLNGYPGALSHTHLSSLHEKVLDREFVASKIDVGAEVLCDSRFAHRWLVTNEQRLLRILGAYVNYQ